MPVGGRAARARGRSFDLARQAICEGRTIWIVDAHGYGKRFIVCERMKSWLNFWN
jgi:hypothetical protein